MSATSLVRFLVAPMAFSIAAGLSNCTSAVKLPAPVASTESPVLPDDVAARIQEQPVCVASSVVSAGSLGEEILYRKESGPDGTVTVGYYVFFSEERPWGNNWLTWSILPALAIDLVYTRALFVLPGLQRAAYGKGDVEGFRVVYRVMQGGRLVVDHAVADDESHAPTWLRRADLFALDPSRLTVVTSTWSHHLGAKGLQRSDLVYERCYAGKSIRPVTPEVASDFNLDGRALPARVGEIEPARPPVREATR